MELIFSDLGFLILFATLGGILAIRFKQPAVIGLLVIGAIIGPHMLGLVQNTETVRQFSDIGAALLLFTIGIEFNISKLSKLGMRVFLIASFKLGIVFMLSYWFGTILDSFFNLGPLFPLYLGAILSITSTALVVRVLEQKDMINRKEVPILVAALIVEDLFAIFALTVFSSLGAGEKFSSVNLVFSILTAIAILSVVYLVLLRALKRIFEWLVRYEAGETMVLMALSLGVGLSFMAQVVGLSVSIGAFLAGSLIASLPKGEELEEAISPFALVFSSLFFMSIGMIVNLNSLGQYFWLILAITLANLLFKFMGTTFSAYLFGFSSKSAVFSGLAMLSVGEFSILIANQGIKYTSLGTDLVGITAVVVFISSLTTSLLVGKYDFVHSVSSALMPYNLKRRGRRFAQIMQEITSAFEGGGRVSISLSRAGSGIMDNAGFLGIVIAIVVGAWYLDSKLKISLFGYDITFFNSVAMIAAVIVLYLLSKILRYFFEEYNLVRTSLLVRNRHEKIAAGLASDFVKLILVLIMFIASPFLLSIINLPASVSRIVIIFIFLILVWRFLDLIGNEHDKGESNQVLFKNK